MLSKKAFVYIMFNKPNGTLYIGVTNDLIRRIYEHKSGICEGFVKKYRLNKLAYFEIFDEINSAITREKQLKKGNRNRKIALIQSLNPAWRDLYYDLI